MHRPLLPLLLLLSSLASVAGGAVWFIQRDRHALVEQFGRERQAQLAEASRGVTEALEDLGDDLRFAGELLAQPGSAEEHRRELRALLEAVGQYRAVAVYGPDGREQLSLVDRRAQLIPREAAHATALADTAREALTLPQGRIVPSPPVEDASSGWMRAFATPLPSDAPGGGGAVAILVDTEPFLMRTVRVRFLESSQEKASGC
ncbi:hypothetical protein [Archangium sp.]|uniref:hypothetical protein n=1 Tax=Archangium sp. TaxID=1872627 RepID=UPI002D40F83E|nr:hypothetical protein [Archangium sp.]HYO53875.1 hypothetical protein [Archangium sp.]